jgi:predicted lipoprotein with Yx(FWY)xxD motif
VRTYPKFLISALAGAAVLAGCGSSKSSSGTTSASQPAAPASGSEATSAVVRTASNAKVGGTILVTPQGMTLYSLSGEGGGKFICSSSACTQIWHPLTAQVTTVSGPVGSLSTVKRPDGTTQVTYRGMPLYTFAQDSAPGEAKGQGLKDVGTWNVVTVQTSAASAPGATTSTPATTTTAKKEGGGPYGY